MRTFLERSSIGALAVAALFVTYGCESSTARAQAGEEADRALGFRSGTVADASAPAGPVLVSCEPGQRTLVRQAMANGQSVTQVECVGASSPYVAYGDRLTGQLATVPSDVRVVPAVTTFAPAPERRVVTERRVVYQPSRESVARRSGRSWQKSAVIIGSTAGIGAGVGAAAGGKKGALIGAAIGGGSAAIWDQVTRNR